MVATADGRGPACGGSEWPPLDAEPGRGARKPDGAVGGGLRLCVGGAPRVRPNREAADDAAEEAQAVEVGTAAQHGGVAARRVGRREPGRRAARRRHAHAPGQPPRPRLALAGARPEAVRAVRTAGLQAGQAVGHVVQTGRHDARGGLRPTGRGAARRAGEKRRMPRRFGQHWKSAAGWAAPDAGKH
ncbi:MAG: hypothetical protein VX670_11595, partial [Candidatus Latescibacterota bacterium]|nr:hypothetical protein [Candidatus Latescibacterota bacterium]